MSANAVARGCPRCWAPLPASVLNGGKAYCGACSHEFLAAVFEPVARAAAVQPPDAAAALAAHCARHARNAALAACDQCGAFMCSLCRVDSGGRALCTACFERAGQADDHSGAYRSWHSAALLLCFAGIILSPLGVLFGPAAFAAALAARRQARRWGDEVTFFTYAWLELIGVLETCVGLLFIVSLLAK